MTFSISSVFRLFVFSLASLLLFSGCKVGDDDPFLSFRSRDARLKANWKMMSMRNLVQLNSTDASGLAIRTEINSEFDGTSVRVQTSVNGLLVSDSTFGFNYQMMLKDEGKVSYENTVILFGLGTKSTGSDSWYWLNTDERKSRVYLGSALQYAATVGIGQLQALASLPASTLLTDFKIDRLQNRELKLSYQKTTGQTTLAGFQQVAITSSFTFASK